MIDYKQIDLNINHTLLDTIIKECYWDSNVTRIYIIKTINSNEKRELNKIFSKIIYNAKDKLLALHIFPQSQLEDLFSDFKVTYNKKYITRHLLVLRSLLLNERLKIKGLEWQKR